MVPRFLLRLRLFPATMRVAMSDPIDIAIDKVGRLVIPKEIREEAGIEPGMALTIQCREGRIEIEPKRRPIRIEKKGRLQIAVSVEAGEALTRAAVKSAQTRARREGES
jgi:AbrB family looped-hinge helix DNA binding protein